MLLVHGDVHCYKVDIPVYVQRKQLANLTRIETLGSPSLHCAKTTADPAGLRLFDSEPGCPSVPASVPW